MSFWQTVVLFGAAVLAFEVVWASVARLVHLNYAKGAWVGLLVYASAAFVASRSNAFGLAIDAGVLVAAIQATLGWAIAALIGPGRPSGPFSTQRAVVTVALVLLGGAFFGTLGAAAERLTHL